MESQKVVITGIGAVSPVGLSAAETFESLINGRGGVTSLEGMEFSEKAPVTIGAPVKGFDPVALLGKKKSRRHARFTQLAVAAAREAQKDAQLAEAGYDPRRVATIIGVGLGGLQVIHNAALTLEHRGPRKITAYTIPALIPNMAAGIISIEAGARGPCYCTASACASSTHAVGEALHSIRSGRADAVICGGAESTLTPLALASFAAMRALSRRNDDPARASRPFDAGRDGFVLGEGAGVMILEREEVARRRGATIYGEVAGYGATADAFHITQPMEQGQGGAEAIEQALADARMTIDDIDYVNAHGTSTPFNDAAETSAIKTVFGARAKELWVSSTKSMTGHLLGGAGGLEAVICAQILQRGVVPPTINLETPDPRCDLDYVPHTARERRIRGVVSNSFGFGGQNATLVLRAVE